MIKDGPPESVMITPVVFFTILAVIGIVNHLWAVALLGIALLILLWRGNLSIEKKR